MPTDRASTEVNEPSEPAETIPTEANLAPNSPDAGDEQRGSASASRVVRGSRWVDYDTHELLEMIGDLEDERRMARLREGFWLAILIHLVLLSAATWIPKYIFKVPMVIDRNTLNQHKDFTYLDTPFTLPPKPVTKPLLTKQPLIDRQTMEEMKKASPPAPAPAPAPAAPAPPPPPPSQQSQLEAPHPAAVPARPNFAMGSQNPADQLRDAMKGASRNPGAGMGNIPSGGGLRMHPGAGSGGVEVLSDTQGVNFNSWLARWHWETERTWDPLIPDEVNPPIDKAGMVAVRFKVLPNGRLMDGSLVLEGRSGDVALDRAAWGALTGSNYPP
ncbi:MAG: energy transducer TonB, partial [Terracidiphilus sp.]